MDPRQYFLLQPAPENYVAGLGRGATGFTTRSDLGPAREGPSEEQIKAAIAKRSAQVGLTEAKDDAGGGDEDDPRYQDPDNEVGLFAGGIYDKDDEEADKIWQDIDDRMAKRRKKQREAREKADQDEYTRKNPTIQSQFADLKRQLSTVSDDEWANLPEAKDLTGRNKRARQQLHQRFYAVPDSVLAAANDGGQFGTTVADDGPAGDGKDGTMTNFAKIGAARSKVLQANLAQASRSTGSLPSEGTATSIDASKALDDLRYDASKADSVSDIKLARQLFESATKSNPKHAQAWIAAARLEEHAGKIVAARKKINEGCEHCPKSEDIWLENIRLNEGQNAKVIAAKAVELNSRSIRLWVEAMKLENIVAAKKTVIRKAIDKVPESEALWKELVTLEDDPKDARLVLAKATELVPASIDLWLALAHLETPENARKVLNKARKAVPTSHEIWIAAARLQEQLGETDKNVLKAAVQRLAKLSAMPSRAEWIAEAEKCEAEGAEITCANIIQATLGWGLDENDDRKDIWMEDARSCIARDRVITARAIYAYALRIFVNSRTLWMAAADLERNQGSREALWQVLGKAVEACPHSEVLWMMLAKEKWHAGDLDGARLVLKGAFEQNPDNEDIWLAAVKLEAENDQIDRARELLMTAREEAPTDRVWIKSVAFERQLGKRDTALELVRQALQLFPAAPKLWMMKGQIYEDMEQIPQAREAYSTGVKAVPSSVPLWILYSRLEEKAGLVVKARSVLDRARQAVPKSPELWCELIRLERRAGNVNQAKSLMALAQKQMPKSGLLWSERIWHLEARTQRKTVSLEGIKQNDRDPILFVAVARVFWAERKLTKAQNWFEKALQDSPRGPDDAGPDVPNSDMGDTWAWYYKFLLQHGTEEKRAKLAAMCASAEPRHGEVWQAIAKDPRNARLGTEKILKLVAAALEQ